MAIVMNLLALALVLGLSWAGMMWLATRAHGRRGRGPQDEEWVISRIEDGDPCPECRGVGAMQRLGRLQVCPLCEGTGVVSTLH